MSSSSPDSVVAEVREGTYGAKVVAVEPGGAEFIPLSERHGKPWGLFGTWMSPNLEFATVFVGVIAVLYFQLTVWQAILALAIGNILGSLSQGVLSSRGPLFGVPQMVLSRIPFGYHGNVLPAGLNAIIATIGWFAVNSVSGAFALASLTGMDAKLAVVIVIILELIIGFFGHNLLQRFERVAFPFLAAAFILAAIWIIPNADAGSATGGGGIGGFLIVVGASFGYAAGWNPYASDYTRYLSPTVNRRAVGWAAGLGVFVSCMALETLGVLSITIASPEGSSPTEAFIHPMPGVVGKLVLLAIFVGAVSANAINIYSGGMSFLTMGFNVPGHLRRAIIALVAGIIGGAVAFYGLDNIGNYENFLLVIAYWVGPWLGVVYVDWLLRRRHRVDGFLFDHKHNPWAGWLAMLIGVVVSIWLFSNQVQYVGVLPSANSAWGDCTFEAGFIISAVLYWIFFKLQKGKTDEVLVIPNS
jgi:purine-cytosine permease-like protein